MQRKTYNYNNSQLFALVALRVLIGWYFLYEGLVKFLNPNWTSLGYLKDSQGFLSPVFNFITEHEFLMSLADNLNIYGLTIIGLLLIVGLFTKAAGFGAISLLSLYYLSHPPLLNAVYMLPTEGSYLWIDKNIIMLCAVVVLILFPTSTQIGLDRIIFKKNKSN